MKDCSYNSNENKEPEYNIIANALQNSFKQNLSSICFLRSFSHDAIFWATPGISNGLIKLGNRTLGTFTNIRETALQGSTAF